MTTPWLIMPTASRAHVPGILAQWRARGYKIALWQDHDAPELTCDLVIRGAYPGVWNAINSLAWALMPLGADVLVFAGDDMTPDPNKRADEIAAEYLAKFPDGFGVMQPCGDPQGAGGFDRPAAARICGSPWFGRGWVRRSYRGNGPTDGRYWHFYGDESLARVAEMLGVMWWRPDLTQWHYHWSFKGGMAKQDYHDKNQKHWKADAELFKLDVESKFQVGVRMQ